MRKVCNCAHADNICVVKSSKSSPAVHMHNLDSISVAEEKIHIKLWHMFLVCAVILITNEAHTYLEKSSSFSHQHDYLTSTGYCLLNKSECFHLEWSELMCTHATSC